MPLRGSLTPSICSQIQRKSEFDPRGGSAFFKLSHITDFFEHHLLDFVAVLLIHVVTSLLGLVGAAQSFLDVAPWHDFLLLAQISLGSSLQSFV